MHCNADQVRSSLWTAMCTAQLLNTAQLPDSKTRYRTQCTLVCSMEKLLEFSSFSVMINPLLIHRRKDPNCEIPLVKCIKIMNKHIKTSQLKLTVDAVSKAPDCVWCESASSNAFRPGNLLLAVPSGILYHAIFQQQQIYTGTRLYKEYKAPNPVFLNKRG